MEDRERTLVAKMIEEAVWAARYRVEIRRDPGLEPGLGRLAAKHSDAATALANEICSGQGLTGRQADPGRFHIQTGTGENRRT